MREGLYELVDTLKCSEAYGPGQRSLRRDILGMRVAVLGSAKSCSCCVTVSAWFSARPTGNVAESSPVSCRTENLRFVDESEQAMGSEEVAHA